MTERQWYELLYVPFAFVLRILYPTRAYGRENVPQDGALFCGNHYSALDPFFIGLALGRKTYIRAMAKDSLMHKPVIGKLLKLIGTFGIKRGESDIAAIKFALDVLKNKEYIAMFPEGTRVKSREEGQPKTGAAMLALRTGCNVVPVYIPMKKRLFRLNRVYIGEPYKMIPEGKRPNAGDYERCTKELMDKIYGLGDGR